MSQPPSTSKTSRESGDFARTQAYVPLRLIEQLGPKPEASVRFRGTAMVADISDYATLLETFSRSGKDGLEGLWQVLGRAFASALELVDAYGGEVVYFAGDALVCYWPEGDGNLDAAALAVTCARRLLGQRLAVTLDRGGEVPVRFHVGLGGGELWTARTGGWSGRWNLLFGGPAVRAAFAALRTAGPGRLAAAGTALQALTRMGRHSRPLAGESAPDVRAGQRRHRADSDHRPPGFVAARRRAAGRGGGRGVGGGMAAHRQLVLEAARSGRVAARRAGGVSRRPVGHPGDAGLCLRDGTGRHRRSGADPRVGGRRAVERASTRSERRVAVGRDAGDAPATTGLSRHSRVCERRGACVARWAAIGGAKSSRSGRRWSWRPA